MRLSSFLLALVLFSGCTSQQPNVIRHVASVGNGIAYPASASWEMSKVQGSTYTSFLKNKLKPALDNLGDKKNGGGGGWDNIGGSAFKSQSGFLDSVTLAKYKGAKWNRSTKSYEGALSDDQVESVYESLKAVKPRSTVDSISYFDRNDKTWATKNDMAIALKDARVNAAPFDLATLYALTGGFGVKVKLDDNNYNYHVLYLTGKTNPNVQVMSGRSFASAPGRGVADATDPEYLKDLSKYLNGTKDQKPFYRNLIMSLADSDVSGWPEVSNLGQSVLSDFFTVYTAEAVRHLMVNLQPGNHPWEIDLAAVTFVSSVSAELGKIVTDGKLVEGDLGGWFAPSPNNVEGGPRRSGIGITRKDRKKFQFAIHQFEMSQEDGKEVIQKIQAIIGTKFKNDVIQGVFEYLSNEHTPASMGPKAKKLADLMATFIELAREDANSIASQHFN